LRCILCNPTNTHGPFNVVTTIGWISVFYPVIMFLQTFLVCPKKGVNERL
jgi:hypothetical protein